jgi:hypothetical protein
VALGMPPAEMVTSPGEAPGGPSKSAPAPPGAAAPKRAPPAAPALQKEQE